MAISNQAIFWLPKQSRASRSKYEILGRPGVWKTSSVCHLMTSEVVLGTWREKSVDFLWMELDAAITIVVKSTFGHWG